MKNQADEFLEDLEALLWQYRMTGYISTVKKKRFGIFIHKDKCGMKFEFKLKYM